MWRELRMPRQQIQNQRAGPGEHGSLISERERSTNVFPLPTLAGNFDGEPNQRLKNARIVFGYFAQNTFKYPSTPRAN